MAYMEWNASLEIGHARIDGEHRSLVETLNRLHAALDQGKGPAEIVPVLAFLRDYAVTHFTAEEALMIQHQYPGAPAHFAAHVELVMKVSDLLADFRAGKAELTEAVLAFLKSWLVDHIVGMDVRLGAYLRNRGVAA